MKNLNNGNIPKQNNTTLYNQNLDSEQPQKAKNKRVILLILLAMAFILVVTVGFSVMIISTVYGTLNLVFSFK